MYGLFDADNLPSKFIGKYSTVTEAMIAAEEREIEYFIIFPDNGGPYSYCSW